MDKNDKDYPPRSGILSQYAHLRGIEENLPVIRKLLGMPEHGQFDETNFIGRAVQRFVKASSKDVLCESK